jgi:hypothetical protein
VNDQITSLRHELKAAMLNCMELELELERLERTCQGAKREEASALNQLYEAQNELEYLYSERQRTRLTGAADRARLHLAHRLGAAVLANSSSVGGWLIMPWTILREKFKFARELPGRRVSRLPPIAHYEDAEEALGIQQELAYRVGMIVKGYGINPIRWLALPKDLRRERELEQNRHEAYRND